MGYRFALALVKGRWSVMLISGLDTFAIPYLSHRLFQGSGYSTAEMPVPIITLASNVTTQRNKPTIILPISLMGPPSLNPY